MIASTFRLASPTCVSNFKCAHRVFLSRVLVPRVSVRPGVSSADCVEKGELVQRLLDSYDVDKIASKYDLIANIVHTGLPADGTYKAHIFCRPKDQWYAVCC
jgi:hypothetical protein